MPVELSPELLDQIFTEVDEHRDLFKLSLACKTFQALIIPNQLHYRIITASEAVPHLYAHLAQRPDLAERIRTFEFTNSFGLFTTNLIKDLKKNETAAVVEDPKTDAENLAKAISYMTRLKSFSWHRQSDWMGPVVKPAYEYLVYHALATRDSLVELHLESTFEDEDDEDELKSDKTEWTWKLPNLKSLVLDHIDWEEPPNNHMFRFLQSAPKIESLEFPGDTLIYEHKIHLPNLKRLEFTSTPPLRRHNMYQFLLDHPTIEHLRWYPKRNPEGDVYIPYDPGFLPNLKRLEGSYDIFKPMEDVYQQTESHLQWRIESLQVGLNVAAFNALDLKCIDRNALKKFTSTSIEASPDTTASVLELGRLFPNITELKTAMVLPGLQYAELEHGKSARTPFEAWLYVLPQFRNLELFFDNAQYSYIPLDSQELRDTIVKIATLCPKLKKLQGWFSYGEGSYVSIDFKRSPLPLDEIGLSETGGQVSQVLFSYTIAKMNAFKLLYTSEVEKITYSISPQNGI